MWPWGKRVAEKVSKSEIVGLLPYTKADPIVFDRSYLLPTDEEVLDVLGSDTSVFYPELNDCDDYAFRAKGRASGRGWPFAIVWVPGHVLTGWINDKKQMVYFEPQSRLIVPKPEEVLMVII